MVMHGRGMNAIKTGKCLKSLPARLALLACFVVVLVWGTAASARQQIKIYVDGKVVEHKTLQRTLGAALCEAGIVLGPQDVVRLGPATLVKKGMTAQVVRGVRVRLTADGNTDEILTQPVTVAEVLKKAGVSLGPRDRLNLPLREVVKNNTEIKITRVLEKIEGERFEVPVPLERRADPSMERGRMRLVRAGNPGEGERLVKVTYVDGKPSAREILQERVLRPAVSRIVAFGTLSTAYRGGSVLRFRNVMEMRATAYSAKAGRYTATGQIARYGVVAVDPQVIPLGTRLYVEGYGYATALDVGSAIKGNRIDVFFPSEADCQRWGRRTVSVYILE